MSLGAHGRRLGMLAIAALAATAMGGRALAACRFGLIAELPVTMEGPRPIIQAKVNGVDERFLADSGGYFNVTSRDEAQAMKLTLTPLPFGYEIEGVGGRASAMLGTAKDFVIAGANLHHQDFIVGGQASGGAGVIGRNVLQMADAEYDLAHGVIRLFEPQDCGDAVLAYWITPKTPGSVIDIAGGSRSITTGSVIASAESRRTPIRGTVYVNGQPVRAMFDTGASTSVLSLAAARRAGLAPDGPGVEPSGPAHGIGPRAVQTWIGPAASFKIGDEEIRNTRLRFADISGVEADMLLGADFFLSHRVYVANSQHKLYFSYNGGPVFDLSRKPEAPSDASPSKETPQRRP